MLLIYKKNYLQYTIIIIIMAMPMKHDTSIAIKINKVKP